MTDRRMRKAIRAAALLLCAALCLSLTACGRDEDASATGEGPTFSVAVSQRPDTLNPVTSEGGLTEEFFLLCYDPLWRLDAAGQPEPGLAEDWSLSNDRLTWTIRLRQDAVFSDGRSVTSKDVAFSYELLRQSTVYGEYFDGVTAIRCPDDYTVVISTDHVKSDMTYNPSPVLPEHIWREYEFDPGAFDNADMIGSGPFLYVPEASGEDGWLFRSRAVHSGGVSKLGAVFFSYYGTATGAARALAAGEEDASFGLTDVQLTTLESVPGVELMETMLPRSACRAAVFNTREERVFANDVLRRAAEYCADREWFLSMSSGGAGMVGSSFCSPGTDYFTALSGLRGFDTAQATAALMSAGYTDPDGDGVLESLLTGDELYVVLVTSELDEWAATAAAILSDDLAEAGFRVDWRKTAEPIAQVCTKDADWDICITSWRGDPSAAAAAGRFRKTVGGLSGWSDPSFDSTLEELRTAEDDAAERSCAFRLQQLVYDACPVVVLAYGADVQAVRSDVWTGFEDILESAGGLFGIESAAVYMSIEPKTEQ